MFILLSGHNLNFLCLQRTNENSRFLKSSICIDINCIAVMYTVVIQTSFSLKNFDNLTEKKKEKKRRKNEVRSQKVKLRPHSLH